MEKTKDQTDEMVALMRKLTVAVSTIRGLLALLLILGAVEAAVLLRGIAR